MSRLILTGLILLLAGVFAHDRRTAHPRGYGGDAAGDGSARSHEPS
jgi:hypothetical protein